MTTATIDMKERAMQTNPANPFAPRPGLKIWLGNEIVPVEQAKISVFDHGLLYGDGVFEGIRIYNGKIFKEKEHLRRFAESAKALRLELPMTLDEISDAMYQTMRANGITGDGYIRLVATRGVGLLGISTGHTACPTIFVIADKIALYPPEVYERGLRCIISSLVRNHQNSTPPRVKSLNYLNNVMAKLEAKDAGVDEAIMLNFEGYVAECTGDNIFLVRDGEVVTPPTSAGILDGVTRGLVMQLARKRGHPVHEKTLVRHDLYVADECFATGTAAEIVPITEINKRPVGDGKPGRITRQLTQDFLAYRNSL
jgi:branched-chain amino acid aminotransferase